MKDIACLVIFLVFFTEFWYQKDEFRCKEAAECGSGTQDDHNDDRAGLIDRTELSSGKICWNEGQQNDDNGVQGDIDKLGLIEIIRYLSSENGKVSAQNQEQQSVAQGYNEANAGGCSTVEFCGVDGKSVGDTRMFNSKPQYINKDLD